MKILIIFFTVLSIACFTTAVIANSIVKPHIRRAFAAVPQVAHPPSDASRRIEKRHRPNGQLKSPKYSRTPDPLTINRRSPKETSQEEGSRPTKSAAIPEITSHPHVALEKRIEAMEHKFPAPAKRTAAPDPLERKKS